MLVVISTLEQVTFSLSPSVSSRRKEIEIALKSPSLPTLIFQDAILSYRLNSQGLRHFASLLLKVYMAQIVPWVSAAAGLPVL